MNLQPDVLRGQVEPDTIQPIAKPGKFSFRNGSGGLVVEFKDARGKLKRFGITPEERWRIIVDPGIQRRLMLGLKS